MTQQEEIIIIDEQNTPAPLERLFGGVTAKILDFLITFQDYDYSKKDIAKHSKVSMRHALLAIEKLEKEEIIIHTRKVGIALMYKYNSENPTAKILQNFVLSNAVDHSMRRIKKEQEQ